ncbi:hypothetical protein MJA45_03615 [Paenibacillus aurantius]|uniref:Uncharacterized protein n=1 Tax=Paenibacillus aurantius TaxID=2918900 RepID=A0AA96RIF7_9BACL|nr:hypothetical protein [Paenibacillus aurantius]WNQ12149.1 hypothetical protein MJA45_03615 [Paenibacillus aurantius]
MNKDKPLRPLAPLPVKPDPKEEEYTDNSTHPYERKDPSVDPVPMASVPKPIRYCMYAVLFTVVVLLILILAAKLLTR